MSVGHSPNEGERYGISEPARLTRKSHVLLLEVEFGFVLPFDDERPPYSTAIYEHACALVSLTSPQSDPEPPVRAVAKAL